MWQFMLIISTLGKPRQEDHKFEANLRKTLRPNLKSIKAETFLGRDRGDGRTMLGT